MFSLRGKEGGCGPKFEAKPTSVLAASAVVHADEADALVAARVVDGEGADATVLAADVAPGLWVQEGELLLGLLGTLGPGEAEEAEEREGRDSGVEESHRHTCCDILKRRAAAAFIGRTVGMAGEQSAKGDGGFSDDSMIRRLRTLDGTRNSIQSVSGWIHHHQSTNPDRIIAVWLQELKSTRNPDKVLNLMYVANDVIQNSVRKNIDMKFANDFLSVHGSAMRHVAAVCPEDKKAKIFRILDVWEERKTFPAKQIQPLRLLLRGEKKKEDTHRHHEKRNLPTSPKKEPLVADVEAEAEQIPSCSHEEREAELRKLREVSDDLVASLTKMDDPPSSDADTRRKLANYREEVSNPALLTRLRNETEADALLAVVEEAYTTLEEFCRNLSTEIQDRRKIQSLLTDYEQCLKKELPRNEKMCHDVKGILQRLQKEQEEVLVHFDSIPDVDDMVISNRPMPSLGDLFRSH
uniref:CID domain-containing protein n=1 Tax=Steinernema glaseri TaxID=37863 RepID=A0A1I7YD87_9BILA